MKILLNNNDLNEALREVSNLGFVPTMGSLHKGHISLIKKSLRDCNKTIVSIFINPTQFNDITDFKRYPRNNKKDLSILKKLKVDYVYLPKKNEIYDFVRKAKIKLRNKDKILCARFRKGHFEGVIDVMDRLTDKIAPKKIFMGEKDFQQLFLVKKYIENKYKSKIIACKTIRNKNKLALSSRNSFLKLNYLKIAGKLAQNLISYKKKFNKKQILKSNLNLKRKQLSDLYKVDIEYLELRDLFGLNISKTTKNSKIFIAYYINKIRLIDNF
tara:strand:- start:59 stop:871 length:813 start_codon:yes stop_codon:yes gene_type:complete